MKDVIIGFIETELMSGRGDSRVSPDDDLLGSGVLDSLGVMQLVWFIGREFETDVPPEDVTIENFQSVAKIEAYLEAKREE